MGILDSRGALDHENLQKAFDVEGKCYLIKKEILQVLND
jgi:hypothetical protein